MARAYTVRKVCNEYGLPLINIKCEGINATSGTVVETQYTDTNGEAFFVALPDAGTVVHIKIYREPFVVEWRYDVFFETVPLSADHGSLSGLADDDHTQYLLVNGTRTLTDNMAVTALKTIDGRDLSVDGSKLDGVEAGADVTDATNVAAAGALMISVLTERGSIIYRNATIPAELKHGTTGQVLTTKGDGADPEWTTPAAGGDSGMLWALIFGG